MTHVGYTYQTSRNYKLDDTEYLTQRKICGDETTFESKTATGPILLIISFP